jgi:hypothetical protein
MKAARPRDTNESQSNARRKESADEGRQMKWIGIIFLVLSFMWNAQKECEDLNKGICGTFSDRTTHLTWIGQDNGSGVSRNDAENYCRTLRLGGQSDWRLPSDSELRSVYDPWAKKEHIKGDITLSTKRVWSSDQDSLSGKTMARYFDFEAGTGGMAEFDAKSSALCVRKLPQAGRGSCTLEPNWRFSHSYERALHVREVHQTFFTATIDLGGPGEVRKTHTFRIGIKDCAGQGCSIPKPGDYPVVVSEQPRVLSNSCVSSKELPATRTICYGSYTKPTTNPDGNFGCYDVPAD